MSSSATLALSSPSRTLPGPRGRPLLGSLLEAWADPLDLFARATREHGDLVGFRFGWLRYCLVNDADAAHRVLVENAKGYSKSRNYAGLKVLLGDGLLTSEGEHWRRQRRLSQPAFHRERLAGFAATMASCTSDMLDRWEAERAGRDRPIDLHLEMMRLTFRIVGRTLLGADLDAEASEFGRALGVALDWANRHAEAIVPLPPWVPTPHNLRFRRARGVIEGVLLRVLAERRAARDHGADLLGMLMDARDEATGEGMTDRQLLDELLTFTLAGHETTANALCFTFYLLSKHPDVARRCAAEVAEALGDRAPTPEDLPRLPFVKATIEEALRLYPPAWLVERQALAPDDLLGHRLGEGVIVGVSPFIMHRNPRYWPNPEGFAPERFLRPEPARPKLAYLPFGAGPRSCIGNAFALMEMQILVSMILMRATIDVVPEFRLALEPSVTLRPRGGVPVRLSPAAAPARDGAARSGRPTNASAPAPESPPA
jgi:cytochrome P450